jgi:hypothetical protein
VAGRNDAGRQHGMIIIGLAVGTFARLALIATELLRTKELGSIERDQGPAAEPLEDVMPPPSRRVVRT